jgi:glycosyltransferase involved in cell wall biosynthesis
MAERLSIVIPAYNEGARLPKYLDALRAAALEAPELSVEFIVSDDGSAASHAALEREAVDAAQAAMRQAGLAHAFRFLAAERNGGKGEAVRRGWASAAPEATWLGFLDADGAISAGEFFRVTRQLSTLRAELVAASRIKMAGHHIERSYFRHLQGRVFATFVARCFELDFYDTQCGFKWLKAERLRPLIPELSERGFLIDLELIVKMRGAGARCVEVPIDWVDVAGSRVRFGIDPLKMFVGAWRLRERLFKA